MIMNLAIFAASVAVFCMVIGEFTWQNIIVASGIVALLMYLFRAQITPKPRPSVGQSMHIIIYAPVLVYYLILDILKSTWLVIRTSLGIDPLRRPGIIKYPIPENAPFGVGPVAYFITLSPGSFLVDVDWEENVILVHVLDASDPDSLRRDAEKYYRLWEYIPVDSEPIKVTRREERDQDE